MGIKLKDRPLPDYTRGEECMNMVTHIVGGAVGIAALVLCVVISAVRGNGYGLAGSIVFGVSMILLYTMSSVYHGLKPGMGKRVLQVLDHCTIYVLIAGTYTPILLSAMRPVDPVMSWTMLGVMWALAAVAITLTAVDMKKYRIFSMICYLGMGWAAVVCIPLLIKAVTWAGFFIILLGGVAYTIGAVLYGVGRKRRYLHSVFHIFVVLGSVLHTVAILLYAL